MPHTLTESVIQLQDYVEDEEIFLALAVEGNAISRQCAEYALQAETTQQAFELLTAELACMAEEIKDQLKQVCTTSPSPSNVLPHFAKGMWVLQ